ncbi:MAG: hypothetical protein IKM59_04055 [Oscillospiraceae bacterium]|nr:hypothetical protein [Oscillospiraceae bacterium]
MPHIDPSSPHFQDMIRFEPTGNYCPDADGFVRDSDGFVRRVIDKYSDPNVPMTRLCPHCHNPLPLPEYGKYPVMFISVVGLLGAGKTAYIHQLLRKFSASMVESGCRVGSVHLTDTESAYFRGYGLIEAMNHPWEYPFPLVATIFANKRSSSEPMRMTLVFYEIPVECFMPSVFEFELPDRSYVGRNIAVSDGMIFMMDPEQFPAFATGKFYRNYDIAQIVDAICRMRIEMNYHAPTWDDIPVAVVISKSDKLKRCKGIPESHPIFTYPKENVEGFDRDENREIHTFLRDLLERTSGSYISPLRTFAKHHYFAVSSIPCGVTCRFPDDHCDSVEDISYGLRSQQHIIEDVTPMRIGDPLKWILWQHGIIPPYFVPVEPNRRRLLESAGHYMSYLEEVRQKNEYDRKTFYEYYRFPQESES